MIPRYQVDVEPRIPERATFWTPTADDLEDEDQLGDFHDGELIITDLDEARAVINAEAIAVAYADQHSATSEEFDEIADQTEFEFPDLPSEEAPEFMVTAGWDGVGGLELGVAGVSYALNAIGITTVASCRAHTAIHRRWAEYPVVILAADRHQVEAIQPLVDASGCGFEVDDGRPRFLAIHAPSIVEMMTLARMILDSSAIEPAAASAR